VAGHAETGDEHAALVVHYELAHQAGYAKESEANFVGY
jgi:hypothetical protein